MLEEERQSDLTIDHDQNIYREAQQEFSRGQKIAAFGLGFFAFFIVIVWAIQFKSDISDPLGYKDVLERAQANQVQNTSGQCADGSCGNLSDEDLKTRDTDGDGLWDWEELNLYGTSPYLSDSDSDGFSDKKELDSDNNPNCPAGRDCDTAENGFEADVQVTTNSSDERLSEIEALLYGDTNDTEASATLPTAEQIRASLREAGMGDDVLAVFSDEEILQLYQESLAEANN